jgi:hypothetical protein
MKSVAVIFVRVNSKPEYEHGAQRWLSAYRKFHAGMSHRLVIINRYCDPTDDSFDLADEQVRYDGGGWDCGAWQFAARNIQADILACFNSSTYVMGDDWLARLALPVFQHGPGLYGPLASYEINPHIRTPCMVFTPEVMRSYPKTVDSREATYQFEAMGYPDCPNVTQWIRQQGHQTQLVTWDGCYDLPDWRKPANIFRRGDQSNLIVKDRHCEAYEASGPANKAMLEGLADGR